MDEYGFYRKFKEAVDKSTWHQLHYGTWIPPEESPNISTVSNNTSQPPLTAESFKQMIRDLRERDPLLRRGIETDWVCVIHPALVAPLEQYTKDNPPVHYTPFNGLQGLLGRRVFIINDAPTGKLEYMTEETMRLKYSVHFLRELELLAQRIADEKNETTDDTPKPPPTSGRANG